MRRIVQRGGVAYALARGAIDGWYAYWFLNPAEQSAGQMLASVALLLCAVAVVAAVLVAVDRWVSRRVVSSVA